MIFIIRPATAQDVPAIRDIYNEAVLHTTASYDYDPVTLESRSAWFEAHARDALPIFVAQAADNSIAGWSALNHFRAWTGYRFTVENSFISRRISVVRGWENSFYHLLSKPPASEECTRSSLGWILKIRPASACIPDLASSKPRT
jgi:L-amino acid N-acyltransferase YncA